MKRFLIIIICMVVAPLIINAQNYQLHSVYMYSFIKYVQWPDDGSAADFVIGVYGDSPVVEHLNKMASTKKAGNRNIIIKKFSSLKNISDCHILFVAKESQWDVDQVIEKVKNYHTMIITEEEGHGVKGSNINFVLRDGKLAFELNKSAMDRAGLKVSNELSKLAIVI